MEIHIDPKPSTSPQGWIPVRSFTRSAAPGFAAGFGFALGLRAATAPPHAVVTATKATIAMNERLDMGRIIVRNRSNYYEVVLSVREALRRRR